MITVDKQHFKECLIETLSEMFGAACVNPLIRGDKMVLTVDDHTVYIDVSTLDVKCDDDEALQQLVHTAVNKLHQSITPIKC